MGNEALARGNAGGIRDRPAEVTGAPAVPGRLLCAAFLRAQRRRSSHRHSPFLPRFAAIFLTLFFPFPLAHIPIASAVSSSLQRAPVDLFWCGFGAVLAFFSHRSSASEVGGWRSELSLPCLSAVAVALAVWRGRFDDELSRVAVALLLVAGVGVSCSYSRGRSCFCGPSWFPQ
jgi:hypothetical protein